MIISNAMPEPPESVILMVFSVKGTVFSAGTSTGSEGSLAGGRDHSWRGCVCIS